LGLESPAAVRLALARDVSPALAQQVEWLRAAIIRGVLTVPEHWSGTEWSLG